MPSGNVRNGRTATLRHLGRGLWERMRRYGGDKGLMSVCTTLSEDREEPLRVRGGVRRSGGRGMWPSERLSVCRGSKGTARALNCAVGGQPNEGRRWDYRELQEPRELSWEVCLFILRLLSIGGIEPRDHVPKVENSFVNNKQAHNEQIFRHTFPSYYLTEAQGEAHSHYPIK